MEDKNFEEFENGLQCGITDGLTAEQVEKLLPMDWEVRTYHLDGNFVCLNVKDYDIDWRVVQDDVEDFFSQWKDIFDQLGLELTACGRSGGYIGFKLQDFLEVAVEINDEEARNAIKTVQPDLDGLEDDDEEYDAYFNSGYDYPFEDDRRIASIYKIDDNIRKEMENLQLDAENTRQEWKDTYVNDFFADEKEDEYYYDPEDDE